MKRCSIIFPLLALLLSALVAAQAPAPAKPAPEQRAERSVAPGLRYLHIRRATPAGEPWSIHVLELDRKERLLVLRAVAGKGEEDEMQRVPPSEMGARAGALAAVNGDFDLPQPYFGISDGLAVTAGRLWTTGRLERPAMAVLASGEPVIAVPEVRIELSAGNRRWKVGALNKPFGSPHGFEPRLYTREFRASLKSETPFSAVVIGQLKTALPLRVDSAVEGAVESRTDSATEIPLRRDVVILAQRGAPLALEPGEKVKLRIRVAIAGRRGIADAIGGFPILVREGRAGIVGTPGENLARRHPRTAVCYNKQKIIFTVVDGRQPELSVGMTLEELADLMVSLGCRVAMNTDGGGSSVMAVRLPDGTVGISGPPLQIVNSPSDGRERGRGNAWVILPRR